MYINEHFNMPYSATRLSTVCSSVCHSQVLATLLDPRYKGHVFAKADTLSKAKQWLLQEVPLPDQQEDGAGDPKRVRVEDEEPQTGLGLVDKMYASLLPPVHSQGAADPSQRDIAEELDRYLREAVIDR